MTRSIKFRKFYRWDKDFKSDKIDANKGDIHISYVHIGECKLPLDRTPISDYLQYTELKDKNGKEIYEGDIIRFNGLNYYIHFDSSQWMATCPYYHKYHHPRVEPFRLCEAGEVIGNIFQNPELLEKNEND